MMVAVWPDGENERHQSPMERDEVFEVDLPEYSIRQLSQDDSGALQELFLLCEDYFIIVEGQGPAANEAEEELQPNPPGLPPGQRDLLGIVGPGGQLVGFLEGLRGYPDVSTWWIGILLLIPEVRSQGLGRELVAGFARYARANGAGAIMLGVVEDNERAHEFWTKIGFELVHTRDPRPFGRKTQSVRVMRKMLAGA
jgi:ribosomal protein S18 acetylase RimI-like enzyme